VHASAPTSGSEPRTDVAGRGLLAVVLGAASTVTMPIAVLATRYFEQYELLHAAYAIPVGAALGVAALLAARSARRLASRSVAPAAGATAARAGLILGLVGLWLAGAAAISVGVYGLLEYVGSRE
jgi:hypothetical protein